MVNNKIPAILPTNIPKCHVSFSNMELHLKLSVVNDVILYMYDTQPHITDAIEATKAKTEKRNLWIFSK